MNKNNTLAIIDSSKIEVSKVTTSIIDTPKIKVSKVVAAPIVVGSEISSSLEIGLKIYNNAETDKKAILSDNKGKAGIYQWTHKESGKMYIGSAVDLSKRLSKYYSPLELKRVDNYVSRAIIHHTHSSFSLSIKEFIDISKLDKKEVKTLILEREQYYIDELKPEYNILPTAGSRLGSLLTAETKAKISAAMSGDNHHFYGKTHSSETIAKISEALSGENHPRGMLGKSHSAESLVKMSEAKAGENHPNYGKNHSAEVKAKISNTKSTPIFVYSCDKSSLINTFPSAKKAAEYLNISCPTIIKYANNGLIYKETWFFSRTLITKELESS